MRTKIFIGFVILLFSNTVFGQNRGKVQLNITPPSSYLKIDDKVIKISEQKIVELNEGIYEVQIWHPKMVMVKDSIEVKANQTVSYRKGLRKVSLEYREHLKKLRKYRVKRAKPYVLAGFTLGGGISGYFLLDEQKKAVQREQNEAIIAGTSYENAVVNIDDFRENYEQELADFNRGKRVHNATLIVGATGLVALTGFTVMQFRKNRKNAGEKPIYDAKNPFVYTNITPTINYQNSNITMGFTLQF